MIKWIKSWFASKMVHLTVAPSIYFQIPGTYIKSYTVEAGVIVFYFPHTVTKISYLYLIAGGHKLAIIETPKLENITFVCNDILRLNINALTLIPKIT
jgi:hypothetical protein